MADNQSRSTREYAVEVDGKEILVRAASPAEARQIAHQQVATERSMTHLIPGGFGSEPESEAYKRGRTMPTIAQAALTAADMASFGLGQRLVSPEARDIMRGGMKELEEKKPLASMAAQVAGSVPFAMAGPFGPAYAARTAGRSVIPIESRFGRSAGEAALEAGLQTVGRTEAESPEEFLKELGANIALGAVGGAGAQAGVSAASLPVKGAEAFRKKAVTPAQTRLYAAILRDMPEDYKGTPEKYVLEQLQRFESLSGEPGRLLDINKNTRALADVLATFPGKAKNIIGEFQEARRAGRADRMAEALERGMPSDDIDTALMKFELSSRKNAEPLYQQLRTMTVMPSQRLTKIVQRADELGATKNAKESIKNINAISDQDIPFSLDPQSPIDWSMSDLDYVKRGIDELIEKEFNPETGKFSSKGRELINIKKAMVDELDQSTIDPITGESVYRSARQAFAGPESLRVAAKLGEQLINRDELTVKRALNDLSSAKVDDLSMSEIEAFRLGAKSALSAKVRGSKAARTQLISMWENPGIRDKLKAIFPDMISFEQFVKDIESERILQMGESSGQGSQTAARLFGAEDLGIDPVLAAGQTIKDMSQGNVLGTVSGVSGMFKKAAFPETTRTMLARMLTERQTPDQLAMMMRAMERGRRKRAATSSMTGGAGSAYSVSDEDRRSLLSRYPEATIE